MLTHTETGQLTQRDYSACMRWKRPRVRGASAVLAVLVVVVLAGGALFVVRNREGGQADRSCRLDAALVPSCGLWWGAALPSRNSQLTVGVAAAEQASGRRLDIVHTYHRWQDSFPTATESRLSASGRLLFMNWEPVAPDGHDLSWAAIGRGDQDATIRAEAARLARVGHEVFVSFSHEPELHYGTHGTTADFAAAFRRVVTVSRQAGATNVRWVWDVMGLADPVWHDRYRTLWPGSAYVDWIGWDPYNSGNCQHRAWRSFADTVTPFYDWLQGQAFAAGKPFMLAEYGSVEGSSPAAKADWFSSIPAVVAGLPRLKALVYFNLPAPPGNCDWLTATSPRSAGAFAALAGNPIFRWTATRTAPD